MNSTPVKPAKSSKASSTRRRRELRRRLPRPSGLLWLQLRQKEVIYGAVSCLVFVVLLTSMLTWARTARHPYAGELVHEPIVNLVDFEVPDRQATERAREEARKASPLIFAPKRAYLDQVQAAIEGLPRAVAESSSIEEVNPELVKAFGLDARNLPLIKKYAPTDGTPDKDWTVWNQRFMDTLATEDPILSVQDFQAFATTLNKATVEQEPSTESVDRNDLKTIPFDGAIKIGEDETALQNATHELEMLARRAGFPRDVTPIVVNRIIKAPQPTAYVDQNLTNEIAREAAARVLQVTHNHERGEILAMPGDVLSPEQIVSIEEARHAYRETTDADTERLLVALAIGGLAAGLCALLASYAAVFYPNIARNALRLSVVLGIVLVATSAATLVAVKLPSLTVLATLSATLIVVILMSLTYDRRIALFAAIMQIVMLALALELDAMVVAAQLITCATMASMLREIRNRRAMIRAATITAVVGAVMFALTIIPQLSITSGAWRIILINTGLAFASAYLVGFVMLGALPSIERIFGLTTGLTLSELRDPRHPLLRQMQQKAPGTYNHSLQIANIAESAADTIGADSLLVYVGALYHDIGKINKPEYFIENQAGGPNKHDKLSPAMSLLIITGHVKDGVELAREYGLPRVLQHFIESHHGTTLIEYFFHAAQNKAAEDGLEDAVEEFEFRYPGPKPRTREAAILMLCDCIESATRAMGEPTPNRIESLVRSLSRKRLDDGQFDECPLSFRELRTVEDSIIKSLCAIYHGRIAYPSKQNSGESDTEEQQLTPQSATA
ncbi:MAG: HDIG domain-containing metalloprotein [Planctomycetota bacterium]|nr:HDIG domain-containing metalloprotein [Planctomycetota bacterium]